MSFRKGKSQSDHLNTALTVNVTTLGPGNIGSFGPEGRIEPEESRYLLHSLTSETYSVPATNNWICIDGRCSSAELERAQSDEQAANPQIAGSLSTTETAVSLMAGLDNHRPVSVLFAHATRDAIRHGQVVTMHGDDVKGKSGCAATGKLRDILLFAGENMDVLLPPIWDICCQMGLKKMLNKEDLVGSVMNGKAAALNPKLWDVTPEECLEIAISNGVRYEAYQGVHCEVVDREDLTDRAFAKARFLLDHATGNRIISVFSTSIGCYKEFADERVRVQHQPQRKASLDVMRALIFNRAARKMLTTERTEVGVIAYRA